MSKKIVIVSSVIAVVLAGLILWWFFALNQPNPIQHPVENATAQNHVLAKKLTVPVTYPVSGTIAPITEGQLAAQVNATVNKVLVQNGDHVTKGQLLIQLDSRTFKAKLAQAKQEIAAAKAIFSQRKLYYTRVQKLEKRGYLSKSMGDQVRAAFLQSKAQLAQAQKQFDQAQIELGYCNITAPAAGIILNRLVDPGDQASLGKTLLVLQTSDKLRLVVNVPAALMNNVHLQQKITVHIEHLTPQNISGIVTEIAPDINPDSRTFIVKISIPKTRTLFPGMYGHAYIPIAKSQVVAIPKQIIIQAGQLQLVKIINQGHIERVFITTGKTLKNNMVTVLSGLNGNEKILLPSKEAQ